MRKSNVIRTLGSTILIAPLLVSCGSDGAGGGGASGDGTLPKCTAGQALSTDSQGRITCKDLPSGTVVWPKCDATSEALTSNGVGVSCTTRAEGGSNDAAVVTKLDQLETRLNDAGTKITMLQNRPGSQRLFVGITTATVNGNMKGNTDNGFTGAAKMCADQFGAGAQMCTVWEIYHSVAQGKITSAMNIAKSWVYFPGWNNPISGSLDPLQGLGDTCGSLTYPTGDLRWTGVAFSTGMLRTTRWGVRFHGGSEAPCNVALPVACCK